MIYDYVTPTGAVIPAHPIDTARIARAYRGKSVEAPQPRSIQPRWQATDNSPCPKCGAAGTVTCQHRLAWVASEPPPPMERPIDGKYYMPFDDCAALVREIEAFCVRHKISIAAFAKMAHPKSALSRNEMENRLQKRLFSRKIGQRIRALMAAYDLAEDRRNEAEKRAAREAAFVEKWRAA